MPSKTRVICGLAVLWLVYALTPSPWLWDHGLKIPYYARRFSLLNVVGERLDMGKCWGRPVFFYLGAAASFESEKNGAMLQSLHDKFAGSQLCFASYVFNLKHPRDQDEPEKTVRAFIADRRISYPLYHYTEILPKMYQRPYSPLIFLLDRDFKVRRQSYADPSQQAEIESEIRSLLNDGSDDSKISMAEPPPAEPDDGPPAAKALGKSADEQLALQRYEDLERSLDEASRGKLRFKDGSWKLRALFAGLGGPNKESEESRQRRFGLLGQWVATSTKPASAFTAVGVAWLSYAAKRRGDEWQYPLTEEEFGQFNERIRKARESFEAALLQPEPPLEAFLGLLQVARGQGWDRGEYDPLHARALAAEPEFEDFYLEKTAYLRWHASPKDWISYVEKAAEDTKKTRGMGLYSWLIINSYDERWVQTMLETRTLSYPRLRQGFRDLTRQYPGSVWNLNRYASHICRSGDKETAKEYLKMIGPRLDLSIWGSRVAFDRERRFAEHRLFSKPGFWLKDIVDLWHEKWIKIDQKTAGEQ